VWEFLYYFLHILHGLILCHCACLRACVHVCVIMYVRDYVYAFMHACVRVCVCMHDNNVSLCVHVCVRACMRVRRWMCTLIQTPPDHTTTQPAQPLILRNLVSVCSSRGAYKLTHIPTVWYYIQDKYSISNLITPTPGSRCVKFVYKLYLGVASLSVIILSWDWVGRITSKPWFEHLLICNLQHLYTLIVN
jgi:hypothetical protein